MDTALIGEGEKISKRVQDEMAFATRCWCIVEAFNGSDPERRKDLHHVINHFGLGSTANTFVKSLARDVILTLSRMTDDPGSRNGRQSLCRISSILHMEGVVEALMTAAENWEPKASAEWKQQNSASVKIHADFITSLVPPRWKGAQLKDRRLEGAREKIRDLRGAFLAHAGDYSSVEQLTINEIRTTLQLISELEEATNHIFLGSSVSLQDRWEIYLNEANSFWDRFSTEH